MLPAQDLALLRKTLGRDLTDVETACFENLWSEHCSYRSTKPLLRTLPTEGSEVLLGPGDDAAIVRFSDTCALAIGMESHNHPSYVDPYDGAATGVGGIVRDVLSMGARPIALMDPLYFGPLDSEKNRYLVEHIVAGIGGYGNCIGVPVVRGELVFDPSYAGNPLVNVVCVGIVDPDRYITARVKRPGSHLVLIGSSTGRDGLGGASFASRDLSEDAEAADRPSVQVGDPYTEKLLIDAILAMAKTGKVLSCRDLGAAGLAGASSEMASSFGAVIHADRVHLRETGMGPREIMLAESQERMLVEVAPEDVTLMGAIAEKYDLRWSDIGEVIDEPRYIVKFHGKTVADLPIDLLVGGAPLCAWEKRPYSAEKPFSRPTAPIKDLALAVLAHPDIAGKDWVYEQYDRDVQLRSVSLRHDAAVLRLEDKALVLSCGCNPRHIFLKPFEGTANAVVENASNLACLGADPLCIVDCLNFASPEHPETNWHLEQCVLGLGDAARKMAVPIVGGNVSLYNESDEFGTRIKPTPSLGMVGRGEVRAWATPAAGDLLALIGTTLPDYGGSVLDALTGCNGPAPAMADPAVVAVVRGLVREGRVTAATDLSRGGLLAALAKVAPCADVALAGDPLEELFSETYGRFLVAVSDESALAGVEHRVLGRVGGDALTLRLRDEAVVIAPEELDTALTSTTRTMRY
ncbi:MULTISPECIES: phosphoribosylformylglycinamidine synthase subunit PurL [unclassified Methanoculleus]|jgi:phosphoribosylformylglycinamidine synthase|uniref:Phosphoribosylformylglycinamidine synthase subunit PurL n=1 Tax=Methanoculleus palmolei TaxID=72612 RepID=A0ABD8A9Q9_9EURY|nr:phosphoribosylformylglycinamidine synthase subunit PurL [Methanoculleus sp. UBA377]WOX56243.1 phosphoribosylformylglycinamidine synthase subunit PurL [Methanoculleus palmolei]